MWRRRLFRHRVWEVDLEAKEKFDNVSRFEPVIDQTTGSTSEPPETLASPESLSIKFNRDGSIEHTRKGDTESGDESSMKRARDALATLEDQIQAAKNNEEEIDRKELVKALLLLIDSSKEREDVAKLLLEADMDAHDDSSNPANKPHPDCSLADSDEESDYFSGAGIESWRNGNMEGYKKVSRRKDRYSTSETSDKSRRTGGKQTKGLRSKDGDRNERIRTSGIRKKGLQSLRNAEDESTRTSETDTISGDDYSSVFTEKSQNGCDPCAGLGFRNGDVREAFIDILWGGSYIRRSRCGMNTASDYSTSVTNSLKSSEGQRSETDSPSSDDKLLQKTTRKNKSLRSLQLKRSTKKSPSAFNVGKDVKGEDDDDLPADILVQTNSKTKPNDPSSKDHSSDDIDEVDSFLFNEALFETPDIFFTDKQIEAKRKQVVELTGRERSASVDDIGPPASVSIRRSQRITEKFSTQESSTIDSSTRSKSRRRYSPFRRSRSRTKAGNDERIHPTSNFADLENAVSTRRRGRSRSRRGRSKTPDPKLKEEDEWVAFPPSGDYTSVKADPSKLKVPFSPAERKHSKSVGSFIKKRLPRRRSKSKQRNDNDSERCKVTVHDTSRSENPDDDQNLQDCPSQSEDSIWDGLIKQATLML